MKITTTYSNWTTANGYCLSQVVGIYFSFENDSVHFFLLSFGLLTANCPPFLTSSKRRSTFPQGKDLSAVVSRFLLCLPLVLELFVGLQLSLRGGGRQGQILHENSLSCLVWSGDHERNLHEGHQPQRVSGIRPHWSVGLHGWSQGTRNVFSFAPSIHWRIKWKFVEKIGRFLIFFSFYFFLLNFYKSNFLFSLRFMLDLGGRFSDFFSFYFFVLNFYKSSFAFFFLRFMLDLGGRFSDFFSFYFFVLNFYRSNFVFFLRFMLDLGGRFSDFFVIGMEFSRVSFWQPVFLFCNLVQYPRAAAAANGQARHQSLSIDATGAQSHARDCCWNCSIAWSYSSCSPLLPFVCASACIHPVASSAFSSSTKTRLLRQKYRSALRLASSLHRSVLRHAIFGLFHRISKSSLVWIPFWCRNWTPILLRIKSYNPHERWKKIFQLTTSNRVNQSIDQSIDDWSQTMSYYFMFFYAV